jgi:hypothetical protein
VDSWVLTAANAADPMAYRNLRNLTFNKIILLTEGFNPPCRPSEDSWVLTAANAADPMAYRNLRKLTFKKKLLNVCPLWLTSFRDYSLLFMVQIFIYLIPVAGLF